MISKYRLITLGCKVNQYESEQIRETLESVGLRPAKRGERAALAVVNTCAVTGSAARKSRQAIRRVSREGEVPTVVVGCYATAAAETLGRVPGVIAVLGHDVDICAQLRAVVCRRLHVSADHTWNQSRMPADIAVGGNAPGDDVWLGAGARTLERSDAEAAKPLSSHSSIPVSNPRVNMERDMGRPIHRFTGRQRAFLKVQDGCDAFCAYCIIPRLRPQLRYRPVTDVVDEARGLVRAGHGEIVVTGVFLGAYGRGTAVRGRPGHSIDAATGQPGHTLADLVEALASIEDLVRLRLSSLEPGDVDARLLSVLRRHDCCVPHLHLPLQAGSDAVLQRMRRQYTARDYVDMIERVNEALDRPAVSTDVVVGFPGETDEDFETTLEIARRSGFCKIHAFPFSPRPGTTAAKWTDRFVHPPTIKERMRRLLDIERETADRFARGFVGQIERVIVENSAGHENGSTDNGRLRHGRSDRYFEVFFQGPEVTEGDVVQVRIDRVAPNGVRGTVVETQKRQNVETPKCGAEPRP